MPISNQLLPKPYLLHCRKSLKMEINGQRRFLNVQCMYIRFKDVHKCVVFPLFIIMHFRASLFVVAPCNNYLPVVGEFVTCDERKSSSFAAELFFATLSGHCAVKINYAPVKRRSLCSDMRRTILATKSSR